MNEPKGPHPTPTGSVNSPQADSISLYSVQGDKTNGPETESLSSSRSSTTGTAIDGKPKSKSKYAGSSFKQERTLAWVVQICLLSLPSYLIPIGVFLQVVGLVLYITQGRVHTERIPYTNCKSATGRRCSDIVTENEIEAICICEVTFNISANFKGRVYMDFQLTNVHQNQRPYVRSVDWEQWRGELFKDKGCAPINPDDNCNPFSTRGSKKNKTEKYIYPCGKFANSMFSDDLVNMSKLGESAIIWRPVSAPGKKSLNDIAFGDPLEKSPKCSRAYLEEKFGKPKHWSTLFWKKFLDNKGGRWERFRFWVMRPSAFSTLTIPYQYFDSSANSCKSGVPGICKGQYKFVFQYRYPTVGFGGTKSLVLSEKRFITDESGFLFVTSLSVGTFCTCIGLVALIFYMMNKEAKKAGRKSHTLRFSNTSVTPPQPLSDKLPTDGHLELPKESTHELSPHEVKT